MSEILNTGTVPAFSGQYESNDPLATVRLTQDKWILLYRQDDPKYVLAQIVNYTGTGISFGKVQILYNLPTDTTQYFTGCRMSDTEAYFVYGKTNTTQLFGRLLTANPDDTINYSDETLVTNQRFLNSHVMQMVPISSTEFSLFFITSPISSVYRARKSSIEYNRATNSLTILDNADIFTTTNTPTLSQCQINVAPSLSNPEEGHVLVKYNSSHHIYFYFMSTSSLLSTTGFTAGNVFGRIFYLSDNILVYISNGSVQFYDITAGTWSAEYTVDTAHDMQPLRMNNALFLQIGLESSGNNARFGAYQYVNQTSQPLENSNNGNVWKSGVKQFLSNSPHLLTNNFYKISPSESLFFYKDLVGEVRYALFGAPEDTPLTWDEFDGSNIVAQPLSAQPTIYRSGRSIKSSTNTYYHVNQRQIASNSGVVYLWNLDTASVPSVTNSQIVSSEGDGFNGIHDIIPTADPNLIFFTYWVIGSSSIHYKLLRWDGLQWNEVDSANRPAGSGSGRDLNVVAHGPDWVLVQNHGSTSSRVYFININLLSDNMTVTSASLPPSLGNNNLSEDRINKQNFCGEVDGTYFCSINEYPGTVRTYRVDPNNPSSPLSNEDVITYSNQSGIVTSIIENNRWILLAKSSVPGDVFNWYTYDWDPLTNTNILLAQNSFSSGVTNLYAGGYIVPITTDKMLLIDFDTPFNNPGARVIQLDSNLSQIAQIENRFSLPSGYYYQSARMPKGLGRTNDEVVMFVTDSNTFGSKYLVPVVIRP